MKPYTPTIEDVQKIIVTCPSHLGKPFCVYPGEPAIIAAGVHMAPRERIAKEHQTRYEKDKDFVWDSERVCGCGLVGKWVVRFDALVIAKKKTLSSVSAYVGQPEFLGTSEAVQDAMVEKVVAKVEASRKERKAKGKNGFDRIEAARLYSEAKKGAEEIQEIAEVYAETKTALDHVRTANGSIWETVLCRWVSLPIEATQAREALKAEGYRWSPKRKQWWIKNSMEVLK